MVKMGNLKARVSALPVKKLKLLYLVYLGCLVVALLVFPRRPVNDHSDMFPYPDPAASLLDMKSDMIFAIANHSSPDNETSLLLNKVSKGNNTSEAAEARSNEIIFNSTTMRYRSHVSSTSVLPRDPTFYEKSFLSRLNYNTSYLAMLLEAPIFASSSVRGSFRSYAGWVIFKVLLTKEGEEEFEELLGMLSSMDSTITSHNNLIEVSELDLYNNTYIPSLGPECGEKSSNNDLQYTIKVVFITFGSTSLFFIIFFLSWKHIKNLTCLGLSLELNTFFLSTLTLDETFLTDHNIYEMLLKEGILVSSGSSGTVYKIKFFELECAMKVFFSHARMDFRRESLIVPHLDHPNIIKFFCVFRKPFIIMELMDEDLYSFLEKVRDKTSDYKLSLEVALDVMLQIAQGMSYLHEEGIAHQDLKSLNILVKVQGEPQSSNFRIIAKIADFGSARRFNPRHPRGFILRPMENIGTRYWRVPELFPPRGGFLTKVFGMACEILPKPLDIYGFAIICSELLTKQVPSSNTNEQRIFNGVELRAGLRPTLPSHGCPEELTTLIEDCWQTSPQLRPEFNKICTRLTQLIEVQSHRQMPSTS